MLSNAFVAIILGQSVGEGLSTGSGHKCLHIIKINKANMLTVSSILLCDRLQEKDAFRATFTFVQDAL